MSMLLSKCRPKGWATSLTQTIKKTLGKILMCSKHPPPRSITIQWHGILTPGLILKWNNVWDRTRSRKEGAFIWSIWLKTVVVNAWRARFIPDIEDK